MEQKEILTIQYNNNEYKIICTKEFLTSIDKNVKKNKSLLKYYDIKQKKILDPFFANNKVVPNVLRYSIDINLQNLFKNNGTLGKHMDTQISGSTDCNILIILESPHKDEYDQHFQPISPAQGITGINLDNHLLNLLNSIKKHFSFFSQTTQKMNIVIVNPVPYQTSLNYLSNKGMNSEVKEQVWRTIWCSEDYQKNLAIRYNKYKNIDLIINACTEVFQNEVTNFLLNCIACNSSIYKCNHPSTWQRLLNNKSEPFSLLKIR